MSNEETQQLIMTAKSEAAQLVFRTHRSQHALDARRVLPGGAPRRVHHPAERHLRPLCTDLTAPVETNQVGAVAGHLVELATAHGPGLAPAPPADAGWNPESQALRLVGISDEPLFSIGCCAPQWLP